MPVVWDLVNCKLYMLKQLESVLNALASRVILDI